MNFRVKVCRTGYGFAEFDVDATTYHEAREKAIDEAGDHSYSEKLADYSVEDCFIPS